MNPTDLSQVKWQPTAPIENLLKRAKIMKNIRQFFADRGVLEVETPVLSEFSVTDVHLLPSKRNFFRPLSEKQSPFI